MKFLSRVVSSEGMHLGPHHFRTQSRYAEGVSKLVQRALHGMEPMHLPVPPAALHAQADMHYFSILLSGACWQHILPTKQVGVYLPGELVDATFELTVITETSA